VRDDEIGPLLDFDLYSTASLGMQLVQVLVRQLDGDIAIVSQNGMCFVITFPEKL
jgi:two-component sensor histidine kinase